ncbi:hypothetical protein EJB05_45451 [Eragrostis curvula]|uniref:Alanyl-tRNA synthetase class IIc N-terminal domain-containing protein n=1 Tax=Eragrostis curvula TaxID=38414 RepID=A0A5J9TK95_9POAL|nr:hypothetical protein EJB05_45451 [Eragrostis curvula]
MHFARKNGFSITRSSSALIEPATREVRAEGSGKWSGDAIRRVYFFAARGHKILPSSSLVPDDPTPTVFLTNAGMLQFKPIFHITNISRQGT